MNAVTTELAQSPEVIQPEANKKVELVQVTEDVGQKQVEAQPVVD